MATLENLSKVPGEIERKDSLDEKASATDEKSVDSRNVGDVWDDQTPEGKERIIGQIASLILKMIF